MESAQPLSRVISVTELNAVVRGLIEGGVPLAWVAGEISNFTRAASGHCYFSIKDEGAQVRCVMFRQRVQQLGWPPGNGVQVEVRALATLYEPRGDFQLNVEAMRRAGAGALHERFERLKRTLAAEGLFAPERKRPLPPFPLAVGVVTSLQAAALRDVLTTLRRRMPGLPVIVYPTPVQGDGAARQIAAAIETAGRRAEVDVVVLCRGGGSLEDLWSFNEEIVARAVAASPIPIVAGVGHETDFTIVDFVADARAPTPTAAAELVSPDGPGLRRQLVGRAASLARHWRRGSERRAQQMDFLAARLRHPAQQLEFRQQLLGQLRIRLHRAGAQLAAERTDSVAVLAARLRHTAPDVALGRRRRGDAGARLAAAHRAHLRDLGGRLDGARAALRLLDPQAVLDRGYGIVRDADGKVVREASRLAAGQRIEITLAQGTASALVTAVSDAAD